MNAFPLGMFSFRRFVPAMIKRGGIADLKVLIIQAVPESKLGVPFRIFMMGTIFKHALERLVGPLEQIDLPCMTLMTSFWPDSVRDGAQRLLQYVSLRLLRV